MALLDASVSLKFSIASVTVVISESGDLICDPTEKQWEQSVAGLVFVFSSRQSTTEPVIVSCHTQGRVSEKQLQECISAAHEASQDVFKFYRDTISRKFSKEIS